MQKTKRLEKRKDYGKHKREAQWKAQMEEHTEIRLYNIQKQDKTRLNDQRVREARLA